MWRLLRVPGFFFLVAGVSCAAPITFGGLLSGSNENPATARPERAMHL